ncbi:MAG: penicillin-binding transpeptidase domain-containing protein [Kofleriaceae bacterium]
MAAAAAGSKRRVLVLTGGVLIAGAAMFASAGGSKEAPATPPAMISGKPLIDVHDKPATAISAPAAAAVAAELELDKMELVGDHYEAPLADGRRAILTLDPKLQKQAEALLDQARAPRAAIVAMATDGRVLALAGRRTDDTKGGKNGKFDFHLATDVWAPAASVFKLVTASALIAAGVDPDEKVPYHGGLRSVVESNLHDDKRDYGKESLLYGVAHSNNAIVGKLAYQHLDPAKLDQVAHDIGLGAAIASSLAIPATFAELDLPHEKTLDFARASAGFEGSRLSVLGGALLAATFADDGNQPAPRLIASIAGQDVQAPTPHRVVSEAVAKAVARMMVGTCNFGSAAKTFGKHAKVAVAGKTGTLAVSTPFYMENSWFVGYAPAEKPQIIVSVLLGNPENWHLRGHEAARRMIDRALSATSDGEGHDDAGEASAKPRRKRHR